MTWDIKAGVMGKPQRIAAEYILSHFPDILEKLTVEEFIAEGVQRREELFKRVEPMRGAAELVKGLVSTEATWSIGTGAANVNKSMPLESLSHWLRALLCQTLFIKQ